MRMSPLDIKKYPKLQQHVSTVLPAYRANGFVIDTMQKLAGVICKEDIKDALAWGQGPLCKVADLPSGIHGEFIKGIKSDVIYLSTVVVKDFIDGNGKRYTPSGDLVEQVTAVLLHELTHWADDQDGRDEDPSTEEGHLFEKIVWGRSIW